MHPVVNKTYLSVYTTKSKIFQRVEAQIGILSLLKEENRESECGCHPTQTFWCLLTAIREPQAREIQRLKEEIQMIRFEAVKQLHKPELKPYRTWS